MANKYCLRCESALEKIGFLSNKTIERYRCVNPNCKAMHEIDTKLGVVIKASSISFAALCALHLAKEVGHDVLDAGHDILDWLT